MANDYSSKLKSPKWQKKRLEVMQRDKFTCQKCGDTETQLNVHHLKYESSDPWDINNKFLITLCSDCHKVVEAIKEVVPLVEFSSIKIWKNQYSNGDTVIYSTYGFKEFVTVIIGKDKNFIYGYVMRDQAMDDVVRILRPALKNKSFLKT